MRNKSDDLARAITLVQVLWFTTATLGRVAQGLHLTSLELTTLSMVLIMLFSAAAWWRKPMGISHPITIHCSVQLSTIISEIKASRDTNCEYHGATPLSFYDRREWIVSQVWASFLNILRFLRHGFRLPPVSDSQSGDFRNSFSSIELFEVPLLAEAIPGVLTQAYSCIFLSAWDGFFPTDTERVLWRASSVIGVLYGFLGCAIAFLDRHGHSMFSSWSRLPSDDKPSHAQPGHAATHLTGDNNGSWWQRFSQAPRWLQSLANVSPDADPALNVNPCLWILSVILCASYVFARTFILVEDAIGLRKQPTNSYDTTSWSRYSILF